MHERYGLWWIFDIILGVCLHPFFLIFTRIGLDTFLAGYWISGQCWITGKLPDIWPNNRISVNRTQLDIRYPDSFNIWYLAGYWKWPDIQPNPNSHLENSFPQAGALSELNIILFFELQILRLKIIEIVLFFVIVVAYSIIIYTHIFNVWSIDFKEYLKLNFLQCNCLYHSLNSYFAYLNLLDIIHTYILENVSNIHNRSKMNNVPVKKKSWQLLIITKMHILNSISNICMHFAE